MTVAPDHHEILLENDQVRVLDTRLGPGECSPVHTHQWPAVLYIQSWSDFIRYDPEGNVLAVFVNEVVRSIMQPNAQLLAQWVILDPG